MFRLITTGLLAAFFFSSTFILNRAMSLQGGHWGWTAGLRYGYMLVLLCLWLALTGQRSVLRRTFSLYREHWLFWTVTGSIGCGVFYALLTYSASYAPGWGVATTWQATILATPLVLLAFGRRVPVKGVAFTALMFAGIVLVNRDQAVAVPLADILRGTIPVVVAAFAYPLGNQLVWESRYGRGGIVPVLYDPAMESSIVRLLLMVLGSVPFWLLLVAATAPPPPSPGQLINTALVAIFSGVIATSLFLRARHHAATPYELAAVDSTQSAEVLFSLVGEIVFLHGAYPRPAGMVGICLVIGGLVLYVMAQVGWGRGPGKGGRGR